MSNIVRIDLNVGDGVKVSEDKDQVGLNLDGDNKLIMIDKSSESIGSNGLYVSDLKGQPGTSGGSQYDGWTITKGEGHKLVGYAIDKDFIDVKRDVVNMIFTFGLYRPETRGPESITYNSTIKDVQSICNEIDAPLYFNPAKGFTSYKPAVGELIQLVTNPTCRVTVNSQTGDNVTTETINRVFNADAVQEVKTMFVIMEIHYMSDIQQGGSEYWVNDMDLLCIYSSIDSFTVGETYHGEQNFDSNHK